MAAANHLVCFTLDDQRFALRLAAVERVIQVVEITPLPRAPEIILGAINMHGRVIPVFNPRRRLALAPRALELDDQFIVAHAAQRTVALLVDRVTGVIAVRDDQMVAAAQVAPVPYVQGVVKLEDGLLLIHDLDAFLSLDESLQLDAALPQT